MDIRKFTYRAPHIRDDLKKCIAVLRGEFTMLKEEVLRGRQFLQDKLSPRITPDTKHQMMENQLKNMREKIKKYTILLDICTRNGWFMKITLDENELRDIYDHKFTDLRV